MQSAAHLSLSVPVNCNAWRAQVTHLLCGFLLVHDNFKGCTALTVCVCDLSLCLRIVALFAHFRDCAADVRMLQKCVRHYSFTIFR